MPSYNYDAVSELRPVYRPVPQSSPSNQQSAQQARSTATTPPLDDECCICLDAFRNKVEADGRSFRMIAKTECNHFFHDFCLTEHLQHGMNKNCPLCRSSVDPKKVSKVNLDWDSQAELQAQQRAQQQAQQQKPNPVPVVQPRLEVEEDSEEDDQIVDEMYDVASAVASTTANLGAGLVYGAGALAWGVLQFGGAVAVGLAKAAAASLTRSNEDLKKAEGTRVASLYNNWNRVSKDVEKIMRANNEEVAVLLSTVNSIPASRTYASQSSVDRIERQTKIFEDKVKELQVNFSRFIAEEKGLLARM